MRAALRALAEMEPTTRMLYEHGKAMGEASRDGTPVISGVCIFAGFKAALIAAAAEGEKP